MSNSEDLKRLQIQTVDVMPGDTLVLRYDRRQFTHEHAVAILPALNLPDGVRTAVLPMDVLDLQVVRVVPLEKRSGYIGASIGSEGGPLRHVSGGGNG